MIEQVSVGIEDLERMLGKKDIEIYVLVKQLQAAQKRLAELEPKIEAQPDLKVVP